MTGAILDDFESALLMELRAHVADRGASRPRRSLGRQVATVGAAAAAACAIAAGAVGLRPNPAFAVERQSDGDIVVTVHELSDPEGLERALAKEGITAEVTYDAKAVVSSELGDGPDPTCSAMRPGDVLVDPADDGGFTITLAAAYLAAHDTVLHLTTGGGHTANDWMGVRVEWEGSVC